jgi:hypothetical protein
LTTLDVAVALTVEVEHGSSVVSGVLGEFWLHE